MEYWDLRCRNCGYLAHLARGTPTPTETLSDLNEDFSNFKIFECPKERQLLSLNVTSHYHLHGQYLVETCPSCGSRLREVEKMPEECPRCRGRLAVRVERFE